MTRPNHQPTSVAHKVTIVGLVVGAVGIGVLSASGVEFPFYPPPGIIILLAGALFLGLAPWRWTSGVGAFLGLFVTIGFLISPTGISNLAGEAGTSVAIGQGIQVIGVVTALIAGVIATRSNYTHPPAGHDHPNGEVALPSEASESNRLAHQRRGR